MNRTSTAMRSIIGLLSVALAGVLFCGGRNRTAATSAQDRAAEKRGDTARLAADGQPAATSAVAVIHSAADRKENISGTVSFTPAEGGVHVVADVSGLTPGKHGFHIHQSADLSSPDLKSAGPHFNPGGTKHGGPDSEMHHAGDLGNLVADEKGHATLDRVFPGLSVSGEKDGVIGHSVVIHAGEDDLKSDPAGNSGARIAAGAIEAAPAK